MNLRLAGESDLDKPELNSQPASRRAGILDMDLESWNLEDTVNISSVFNFIFQSMYILKSLYMFKLMV